MLKIIRRRALDNPLFYKLIMGVIAVTFVVSLGWWGSGKSDHEEAIAHVNAVPIALQDYQRAYKNMSGLYRDLLKDQYDDKKVRKQAIDGLVEQRLWVDRAHAMALSVTDKEVSDSILKITGFQKEGKFDTEIYRNFLSRNRLTPLKFEQRQREQLVVEKAKEIVEGGVALSPDEIESAKKNNPSDLDKTLSDLLTQKKQRAVMAYGESLRKKQSALIKIQEELL